MTTIHLNLYQAVAVAALVYGLGRMLVGRIPLLGRYCIPAPVVGGLIFALCHLALRWAGVLEITFDDTLQTFFMMIFFTSVGFTACFKLLKKGGAQVFVFLGAAILVIVLQNMAGASLASLFGLDARLGLCVGSIPMIGGHATSGSFGRLLEDMGVTGAASVSIAAATFGLVAGSVIGGPLARSRILRHSLAQERAPGGEAVPEEEGPPHPAEAPRFTNAALYLAVAVGLGTILSQLLGKTGLTFPAYIGAMIAAVIIRNIWDANKVELPIHEIDILGSVSLSLFLSMALMGLRLWELAGLALPMVVMLLAQVLLMAIFAYLVVFRAMGKDYEAAVMTTAFCGFGMGATPNAMANMQAVARRYGPATKAFFIVPLVGSLFIDFFNSVIITTFLNLL